MSATKQLRQQAADHLAARRFPEAAQAYGELLAKAPQDVEALHRLGMLKVQTGAPEEGRSLLAAALALDPGHPEAHLHHGMALQNLNRGEDALEAYRRAVSIRPDYPEALFQLGALLRQMERIEEAHASFDRCAALAPAESHVYLQRGEMRFLLGNFEGALADFDHAVRLAQEARAAGRAVPNLPLPQLLFNRALALESLMRDVEALATYDQVTKLAPGLVDAWSNRGGLLLKEARLDEAEASYRRALALNPNHIPARTNRGVVRTVQGRDAEAMADFRHLAQIDPTSRHVLGGMLAAALPLCDWDTVDSLRPRLAVEATDGRAIVSPFPLLLTFSDPKLLHDATLHFQREFRPPSAPRPPLRPAGGKIRIAYLSADFHAHATAHLMAGLFERHDRSRFEVIAIAYGVDDKSEMRARLMRAFDRFIDIQPLSDVQAAAMLREMQVDIAIDLKGYTLWSRSHILAHGAAPVQVSYLGYPGTVAAPSHDYVLADAIVLPHDEQPFWSEKIVHLPGCYQVNDPHRAHPAPASRSEAGLPESGFVFCCFNNHRKIGREVFDSWMRLLAAVPGSLLWLLHETANEQLRAHAAARGIDPSRLVFAPRLEAALHLRRLPCADLMLDTLPYGAHTTASDALWMGVPMVTCRGTAFAGRVGASLLTAAGLPELIAETMADYEALALALARDGERLRALREKLAANRLGAPLFDVDSFRRDIEQAYITMMEIARAGEAPRAFDVPVAN